MTLTDSPGAIRVPQPSGRTRRGPTSAASHAARDAHTSFAGGTEFPDAIACPSPNPAPHRGPKTAVSRDRGDAQMLPAGGADIPDAVGHPQSMARSRPGVDTAAPATKASPIPSPPSPPVLLDDPFLYLAAAVLDDAEKVRTANANRLSRPRVLPLAGVRPAATRTIAHAKPTPRPSWSLPNAARESGPTGLPTRRCGPT
jgi:hypothetical protein